MTFAAVQAAVVLAAAAALVPVARIIERVFGLERDPIVRTLQERMPPPPPGRLGRALRWRYR